MVKTNGQANLQPSQPANLNAARHGLHSSRFLASKIEGHREKLLALPWLVEVDTLAVDEVSRPLARIESLDIELNARGNARTKTLPRRSSARNPGCSGW
jgi:hypothetical protein